MLCDSNIWLALALSKHVHHTVARDWLETVEAPAPVFFCRPTQQALLRLLTNASVLGPYGNPPLTNRQAWAVYETFLSDDRIAFTANEPVGLEPLWKEARRHVGSYFRDHRTQYTARVIPHLPRIRKLSPPSGCPPDSGRSA